MVESVGKEDQGHLVNRSDPDFQLMIDPPSTAEKIHNPENPIRLFLPLKIAL